MKKNNIVAAEESTSFRAWFTDESPLYFAGYNKDYDQKRGLVLYGPAELNEVKDNGPIQIRIGIVGTGDGIHSVNEVCTRLMQKVSNNNKNSIKAPPFPGMEQTFRVKLIVDERWNATISSSEVKKITSIKDSYDKRVRSAAELYAEKVGRIWRRDTKPDVIICHQDKELETSIGASTSPLEKNRNPLSAEDRKRINDIKKNLESHTYLFAPLDQSTIDMIEMRAQQDFRRQLKALCMQYDISTQILAQSTIDDLLEPLKESGEAIEKSQDAATIAWNISAAIYFKAGYSTWRVANLNEGTCYVGISFYYENYGIDNSMRASLAQIFTEEGKGMVIRGDLFRWNKSLGEPHLKKESAFKLLSNAILLYQSHKGHKPNRIVVHKTSDYNPDEAEGFREAASEIQYHDFISLRKSRGYYIYRNGIESPLRGTVVALEKDKYLVFSVGHIPYLKSYPGPRIPHPLEVWKFEGDSSPEVLIHEILALTRLNWNSTTFSSYMPITLQFARKVGGILSMIPKDGKIQTEYRYFM